MDESRVPEGIPSNTFSYSEVCKLIQEAKALMEIVDIVGYKQYVIGECPVHQFITEFEKRQVIMKKDESDDEKNGDDDLLTLINGHTEETKVMDTQSSNSIGPPGISRQTSWGTSRLEKLRERLGELNKKFNELKDNLGIKKEVFVKRVIDSAKKLEACLEKRREELGNSLRSSLEGPIADNDNKQSMAALAEAGPEWGVEAALAFKIFPLSSSDKLAKCAFVISGSSSIKPFLISRSRMAKSSNFTFVTQSPFAAAPSITYRNISRWSKPATCCCRSHKISHSARIGIILSL